MKFQQKDIQETGTTGILALAGAVGGSLVNMQLKPADSTKFNWVPLGLLGLAFIMSVTANKLVKQAALGVFVFAGMLLVGRIGGEKYRSTALSGLGCPDCGGTCGGGGGCACSKGLGCSCQGNTAALNGICSYAGETLSDCRWGNKSGNACSKAGRNLAFCGLGSVNDFQAFTSSSQANAYGRQFTLDQLWNEMRQMRGYREDLFKLIFTNQYPDGKLRETNRVYMVDILAGYCDFWERFYEKIQNTIVNTTWDKGYITQSRYNNDGTFKDIGFVINFVQGGSYSAPIYPNKCVLVEPEDTLYDPCEYANGATLTSLEQLQCIHETFNDYNYQVFRSIVWPATTDASYIVLWRKFSEACGFYTNVACALELDNRTNGANRTEADVQSIQFTEPMTSSSATYSFMIQCKDGHRIFWGPIEYANCGSRCDAVPPVLPPPDTIYPPIVDDLPPVIPPYFPPIDVIPPVLPPPDMQRVLTFADVPDYFIMTSNKIQGGRIADLCPNVPPPTDGDVITLPETPSADGGNGADVLPWIPYEGGQSDHYYTDENGVLNYWRDDYVSPVTECPQPCII